MRCLRVSELTLVAVLCAAFAKPAWAHTSNGAIPEGGVQLVPDEIAITLLYGGATIRVQAITPADHEIALLCTGKEERVDLKRKGRVLGVVWMNVGELTIDRVPSLYIVKTSARLAELASAQELAGLGVGYGALRSKAGFDVPQDRDSDLFDEFVRLRESEGLYRIDEKSVSLRDDGEGATQMTAEVFLPPNAAAMQYRVRVIGFRNGHGQVLGQGHFAIKQAGMVSYVSSMARSSGLLYGSIAVVLALAAGLLVGFLFGLRTKGGR